MRSYLHQRLNSGTFVLRDDKRKNVLEVAFDQTSDMEVTIYKGSVDKKIMLNSEQVEWLYFALDDVLNLRKEENGE